jgi:hypothetical protein
MMIAILLAGLVDAVGGAYKDYPLEGFKPWVFPRSLVFALAICWIPFSDSFVVSFLCGGYVVRALVEIKKWIVARGDYKGYWDKRIRERLNP